MGLSNKLCVGLNVYERKKLKKKTKKIYTNEDMFYTPSICLQCVYMFVGMHKHKEHLFEGLHFQISWAINIPSISVRVMLPSVCVRV